ncbi:hypothetical protein BBD42_12950 [Paenibacillus sp. BIHB 4019]|uniref:HTH cro/C1-type domain-containing protein n=1 Tax=Paenibacillus sp. BIHB 4019 TaxID=1870819 RepID=A0A1B2DHT7_9BACL|nr:helix-turn-helix transcriptional regulator [Paenibacillus sp. BIHB 4019]ANY67278.1 hypothetical protein BBD42_12950 [Paenibacillus sp. BIHB 4019]
MREWLKEIRKQKGLTQLQAAKLSGISRSYYADIERGSANASGAAAKLIADALEFEMSIFFADVRRVSSQNKKKSA